MTSTKIEWADRVWNPTTGCTRVSAGCEHCYIERQTPMRVEHRKFDGPQIGATLPVRLHPGRLGNPVSWRGRQRIFVNSMSDLFHRDVPTEFLAKVWAAMASAPRHTFLVLTKRPDRMRTLLGGGKSREFLSMVDDAWFSRRDWLGAPIPDGRKAGHPADRWPLPNVWLGTSVEDQSTADLRIPKLLDTRAAVRWISAEPLLGPVDLCGQLDGSGTHRKRLTYWLDGRPHWGEPTPAPPNGLPMSSLEIGPHLDWVVVGGETGPGSRPMHPDWARRLRDQCAAAGVPYFFKQWGDWGPYAPLDKLGRYDFSGSHSLADDGTLYAPGDLIYPDGPRYGEALRADHGRAHLMSMYRLGKKTAGRELDDQTHDEYPAVTA